jgi:hypothetical protein
MIRSEDVQEFLRDELALSRPGYHIPLAFALGANYLAKRGEWSNANDMLRLLAALWPQSECEPAPGARWMGYEPLSIGPELDPGLKGAARRHGLAWKAATVTRDAGGPP